jgi:cyclopropane fatty-acyl-phospholipid synthase-like methyltransferase
MRDYQAYPVFLEYLETKKYKKLLDVGCGPGWLLKAAVEREIDAYGIDFSGEALNLAQQNAPDAHFQLGRIEKLDFKTNSFDYLTCIGVLEHFIEVQKSIQELKRVGKNDALYCIMVPNSQTLYWKFFERFSRSHLQSNENALNLDQWKFFFSRQGFEILATHRDEWQIRKMLNLLGLGSIYSMFTLIKKIIWSIIPIKYAHQFVFILKKQPRNQDVHLPPDDLSRLYDTLSQVKLIQHRFKFYNRPAYIKMHKQLYPAAHNRFELFDEGKISDVEDLVLQLAELPKNAKVFDAGCGFGGTIFHWQERVGGNYVGVTLSQRQLDYTRMEAKRLGVEQNCQFYLRSYDQPFDQKYDVILAIESLLHSPNIYNTLSNFLEGLVPGGKLIVVDDMVKDSINELDPDLLTILQLWQLADLPSVHDYHKIFAENNLNILVEKDLTPLLKFTGKFRLKLHRVILNLVLNFTPNRSLRFLFKAHIGGFALQNLYLRNNIKYYMLVVKKL